MGTGWVELAAGGHHGDRVVELAAGGHHGDRVGGASNRWSSLGQGGKVRLQLL